MNSKKLLILTITIIMLFSLLFAGCINKPEPPASGDSTPEPNTNATPEATTAIATPTPVPPPNEIMANFSTEITQDIINILLVGNDSDSSEGDGNGRNDTTMVLQINRVDNTMKLISFMRDMVFDIPGIGITSLNNAYYHGGAYTLSKLLKDEFGIKIDYYVSVSFNSFYSIMDIVGSVSISSEQNVIPDISENDLFVSKNPQNMTPSSSLYYVRDRHNPIIDPTTGYTLYSDEARNYRQRVFTENAWEKVKGYPQASVPVGVLGALAYLDTDMDVATIITLIKEMMDANATIESMGLPARRSAEKPYYSLYKDLTTEEILSKSEIEAIYQNASDKETYDSYEDWKDAHYKVSHIIGWNEGRTKEAVRNFLILN